MFGVIENKLNDRGVNSHLTWEMALSCSFRPSISIHFCFWDYQKWWNEGAALF